MLLQLKLNTMRNPASHCGCKLNDSQANVTQPLQAAEASQVQGQGQDIVWPHCGSILVRLEAREGQPKATAKVKVDMATTNEILAPPRSCSYWFYVGVYISLCTAHILFPCAAKFIKLTLHFGSCIWFYGHVASDFRGIRLYLLGTFLGVGKLIQLRSMWSGRAL